MVDEWDSILSNIEVQFGKLLADRLSAMLDNGEIEEVEYIIEKLLK